MDGLKVKSALIGLLPSAAERYTAAQIVSWTRKALRDIGLTYDALTRHEGQDAADSAKVDSDGPILTNDDLTVLGI